MDVEVEVAGDRGEVALTLQNMKEHFTLQSRRYSMPSLRTCCQNIDRGGWSKLHFYPHVSNTLSF